MNGSLARGDNPWIARATSSLPVPRGPSTSTGRGTGATFSIFVITSRICTESPTICPAPARRLAQPLVGRAQLAVLVFEPLAVERVLQDPLDLLDRDLELVLEVRILRDEVGRAGFDRGDGVVDRAVARSR